MYVSCTTCGGKFECAIEQLKERPDGHEYKARGYCDICYSDVIICGSVVSKKDNEEFRAEAELTAVLRKVDECSKRVVEAHKERHAYQRRAQILYEKGKAVYGWNREHLYEKGGGLFGLSQEVKHEGI